MWSRALLGRSRTHFYVGLVLQQVQPARLAGFMFYVFKVVLRVSMFFMIFQCFSWFSLLLMVFGCLLVDGVQGAPQGPHEDTLTKFHGIWLHKRSETQCVMISWFLRSWNGSGIVPFCPQSSQIIFWWMSSESVPILFFRIEGFQKKKKRLPFRHHFWTTCFVDVLDLNTPEPHFLILMFPNYKSDLIFPNSKSDLHFPNNISTMRK